MLRIGAIGIALLCLGWLGLRLWLAPLIEGPPHFTIEHSIEFSATPEEAWAVLMDASAYAEWNPYLLELRGTVEVGNSIEISIVQENWDEPMRLTQTVIALDPPRYFHWRGQLPPAGLFQTDHSFRIEPITDDRIRFVQREEFRGKIAEFLDEEARKFTERAFASMDEALARRVAELRIEDGQSIRPVPPLRP